MLEQNDPVTVCCGRPISRREMAEIRETVTLFGNLSQKELSHTICEHLDWRTASGTNKWDACLKMLKQFEKQGLISLPPKKIQAKPARKKIRPTARTDPGEPIRSDIKHLYPITLSRAETRGDIRLWNEYVHRYHYLGYHQPFGYTLRYFVKSRKIVLGCALFSGAAKAIAPRDRWIGWDPRQRLRNLAWIINNSRFLIFPWVEVKNLASHVLGQINRHIAGDWEEKWGFSPVLMETFVDPALFPGTCYRAANWTYLGLTTGKGLERKGKTYQTTPKQIFVKPINENFRNQLCDGECTV